VNILFVMKIRGNAGNTHAVANYIRVAPKHGHAVALYGDAHPYLPELKFSSDIASFDRVIYLFESELYRLKPLQEAAMLGRIPKRHRLIFDMDGMYNPVVTVDGYDFNHASEAERIRWTEFYEALSDRIAKPTLAAPDNARVRPMLFYGYDPALQIDPAKAPPKQFDILHVGHNWWRWREVESELLPAFAQIRDQVGEIGFIGLWWDKPPAEGPEAGPEAAFQSDPEAFGRLRIRTDTAVMYTDVIATMSTARINIFTQRPVLHHLKHLTLKYFEIFYADTIPLLMLDRDLAEAVYGPAARELVLRGRVAGTLLDALRRPDHYCAVVEDVRRHLARHYSYDRRVEELSAALQD
jgi:hypothetical protein